MNDISIRESIEEDIPFIAELIESEWKFSIYSKEKSHLLCEWFAVHCLSRSNHCYTAVIDEKTAGIILFSDGKPFSSIYSTKDAELSKTIADDPSLQDFLKDAAIQRNAYLSLISKEPNTFGELSLLMVHSDFKGLGLGRKLMDILVSDLKNTSAPGVLFYTDSECNYKFYDHYNCELIGVKNVVIHGYDDEARAYRLKTS